MRRITLPLMRPVLVVNLSIVTIETLNTFDMMQALTGGVTLTATTLVNVEEVDLGTGFNYSFTLNDANDTSSLKIDGGALVIGNALTVNGTAETMSSLIRDSSNNVIGACGIG